MSDISGRALGEMRAEIATRIVKLQSDYYGKGPTKARTYVIDDLVVVVLEDLHQGQADTRGRRRGVRRRFQQKMADEFRAIVEQAAGRSVRAFLSETNVEADLSVEIFLLGDARADMAGFEEPDCRSARGGAGSLRTSFSVHHGGPRVVGTREPVQTVQPDLRGRVVPGSVRPSGWPLPGWPDVHVLPLWHPCRSPQRR